MSVYSLAIADDEETIRFGLRDTIDWQALGFAVVTVCANGNEVTDYLTAHSLDALLCDINMPISTGLDVAKFIHENKLPTRVVMLSGYRDFEYARTAIQYGVTGYITKPVDEEEMINLFTQIKSNLDERTPKTDTICDNAVIQKAKEYIRENCAKGISLADVATAVYLSPSYFSVMFREQTGQTFTDYLIAVRMEKAKILLSDLQYKIYEVSEMVGYDSTKYFSKLFRTHTGLTPSEYRLKGFENEN